MLELNIRKTQMWDEYNECFITVDAQTIQLEHSLVSLSNWESKWCKPFIGKTEKTREELIDYIKCMTITPNVDPNVYNAFTQEDMKKIEEYISSPHTATQLRKQPGKSGGNTRVTSERIYFWMISLHIPVEFQHWHLNRLLTLIELCNIENQPKKKMSKSQILRSNAKINAARRAKYNSKG